MPALTSGHLKQSSLELLRIYQSDQSPKIRNQIVELNIGLVRKEAHHWVNQCNESYEDLIQVGCMGLIRAIERFELSKGNAFSSFAVPYIRGEIQHYLRDRSTSVKIPRRWLELRQQATKVTYKLRAELKREPTDSEIALKLNISLKEWQEVKLAAKNREPLSLDMPMGSGEGDETTSLGELVPDTQYRSFQLAQEDQIRLQQGLIGLEERTRKVLEFVFLHDLTQKEVAEVLGVSVVTVSRRLKKGVSLLKNKML
ncbi:MAG: sigma-70 family RNA polymerase sigma factor [Cyanobacteria bacterium]|jgi:RNA polymerase sigma-B factor|nr:sigma-70 family RNA polymerase sigma factor [Cyanobacteria bacterium GSL.Bin21]